VRAHRLRGRRVIVTNGVFDVLHRGHVTYLNQAKALGDVLVVGLNSDASVRRLKGPERPLNPAEDRAAVLSGLSCVDHVVVFDGDTSIDVLDVVRPDVYVKGGDYTPEMLPEAPHVEAIGAEIIILPYLEDRSTTGLVTRIRTGGQGSEASRSSS
jgi:D-beta-D-heptose 7-phosphate kinase/D-beta-D-heptose 1-phosphate adenosyltransferase